MFNKEHMLYVVRFLSGETAKEVFLLWKIHIAAKVKIRRIGTRNRFPDGSFLMIHINCHQLIAERILLRTRARRTSNNLTQLILNGTLSCWLTSPKQNRIDARRCSIEFSAELRQTTNRLIDSIHIPAPCMLSAHLEHYIVASISHTLTHSRWNNSKTLIWVCRIQQQTCCCLSPETMIMNSS